MPRIIRNAETVEEIAKLNLLIKLLEENKIAEFSQFIEHNPDVLYLQESELITSGKGNILHRLCARGTAEMLDLMFQKCEVLSTLMNQALPIKLSDDTDKMTPLQLLCLRHDDHHPLLITVFKYCPAALKTAVSPNGWNAHPLALLLIRGKQLALQCLLDHCEQPEIASLLQKKFICGARNLNAYEVIREASIHDQDEREQIIKLFQTHPVSKSAFVKLLPTPPIAPVYKAPFQSPLLVMRSQLSNNGSKGKNKIRKRLFDEITPNVTAQVETTETTETKTSESKRIKIEEASHQISGQENLANGEVVPSKLPQPGF